MLTSHPLSKEFPELLETMQQLKTTNGHFSNLLDKYEQLDAEILKIEEQLETPADSYAEDLKKQRVQLKDELYHMLKEAAAA